MKQDAIKMYVFKFVYNLLETWSEIMFWLLFFSCMTIFTAYKMQMNAYLLLPEMGESTTGLYDAFKVVISITLIAKIIATTMRVIEQASMDVFFVDFEKPNYETRQVNGWRYYFVANEYAELMTGMRYVQPETTFIWFIFFYIGLGWKHIVETSPDFNYEPSQVLQENLILKFFLTCFLFVCIGAVEFVLHSMDNYYNGSAVN